VNCQETAVTGGEAGIQDRVREKKGKKKQANKRAHRHSCLNGKADRVKRKKNQKKLTCKKRTYLKKNCDGEKKKPGERTTALRKSRREQKTMQSYST